MPGPAKHPSLLQSATEVDRLRAKARRRDHARRVFSRTNPAAAIKAIEPGGMSQSEGAGVVMPLVRTSALSGSAFAAPRTVPTPTTVMRTAALDASATNALLRDMRTISLHPRCSRDEHPFERHSHAARSLWQRTYHRTGVFQGLRFELMETQRGPDGSAAYRSPRVGWCLFVLVRPIRRSAGG